ncbi:unnamed protein product [Mesocestoides corti]|uniref:SCP domain-containing protein n=1 Tax=Mesocestoides corti TaxID=53468 RepID=A0A0R3UPX4_MESCO|nr:unnamed protein product [Mesocestoides corti]
MVWATWTEVGCAINRCDNLSHAINNPVYFLTCQYKPWAIFLEKWANPAKSVHLDPHVIADNA